MNAANFTRALTERGRRSAAMRVTRLTARITAAIERRSDLPVQARADGVEIRLREGGHSREDGRLRWLALWVRELIR
ncbi:MAG: hypothetical protein AAGD40_02420 [Pseudomonadota bacterium]